MKRAGETITTYDCLDAINLYGVKKARSELGVTAGMPSKPWRVALEAILTDQAYLTAVPHLTVDNWRGSEYLLNRFLAGKSNLDLMFANIGMAGCFVGRTFHQAVIAQPRSLEQGSLDRLVYREFQREVKKSQPDKPANKQLIANLDTLETVLKLIPEEVRRLVALQGATSLGTALRNSYRSLVLPQSRLNLEHSTEIGPSIFVTTEHDRYMAVEFGCESKPSLVAEGSLVLGEKGVQLSCPMAQRLRDIRKINPSTVTTGCPAAIPFTVLDRIHPSDLHQGPDNVIHGLWDKTIELYEGQVA